MTAPARMRWAAVAVLAALVLGVAAAWPIYGTVWLLVPAAAALVLGVGIVALAAARGWSGRVAVLVLGAMFVLTVAVVAVPGSVTQLPFGLLSGTLDGTTAVVRGWKQLLTLALPVGTYRTMLVPAYTVFLLSAFVATWIAVRGGRGAALAAVPLLAPVAFGTLFGSAEVSAAVPLGPLSGISISGPREVGLWLAASVLGVIWVAYSGGAARRAALRLGRQGSGAAARGRLTRMLLGAATLVVALLLTAVAVPAVTNAIDGTRQVPRDRIAPELVIRAQASPLSAYRAFKSDDRIDAPMFTVQANGPLPGRLRIAVLDDYDGVDFHVGSDESNRFTRFPSGERIAEPTEVSISMASDVTGIWMPTAGLGSSPSFTGPRATELEDGLYVNRRTGAAIAVTGEDGTAGLIAGDGFRAQMSAAPDARLVGDPDGAADDLDPDLMPELTSWVKAQNQPATALGLGELIRRLRERGYLSHAISLDESHRAWLDRLTARYGTRFESSAGGASLARVEQLFGQLNTQQRLAGPGAPRAALVAAIGDDEQFATAAALLARSLGFESRVVLGVRLGGENAGVPGVPACSSECTGEHLAAWIEVRGSGGWAPIDVTPQLEVPPVSLEEGQQLPEFPTTPEERDAREVDPPLGLGEPNEDPEQLEEQDASWLLPVLRIAGLSLSALLLLALPLLFLPLAKLRRRRSRRAYRDPEVRALAAWHEMLDRAVDAGVQLPRSATRSEIAAVLDTAPARWAAAQVDRAVFSPGGIPDETADVIWAAADADWDERRGGLSRWQRLRARYALRSYGIAHGRSHRNAGGGEAAAHDPDESTREHALPRWR